MSRDIKRLQSAISQLVLTLMCFTEHKWVGNWEREGENEKERGLWGESFRSLFSLWLSSGELLLALSPCVLSISVPTMPSGSQPSNEFQALLWSTCAAWHQSQMKWETEGDDGKREEWERATVMRLKEMPPLNTCHLHWHCLLSAYNYSLTCNTEVATTNN